MKNSPASIDEYIASFPQDVQRILQKLRTTIRVAAPAAEETIKYQIPTFTMGRNLIHFAAYKNHIGVYPAPSGIQKFKKELSVYGAGKGTLKFPLDQPIPYDLITRLVKFRVKEELDRQKTRRKNQ